MLETNQQYHEKDQEHYLPTFKRHPLAIARGKGSKVWDVEGRMYIDMLAGIAVNNLGHCHPNVVKAIRDQAATLMHVSNFYVTEPQVKLSELLTEISGIERVFLANSGAEAVEGAFKIARKYSHSKGRGGTIVSFKGSFHGRTLATIATGKAKMQKGFEPIPQGFVQAEFNNMDSVREVCDDETAAIIIEPVQGEGGVNPVDADFLRDLRTYCDNEGIVLIFDEIQCGLGRTGKMFAKDHFNVQPDIMTLAKALGNGVPVAAVLSNEEVSSAIEFGDHGTTFGGNPLVCAAAIATIDTLRNEDLPAQALQKGQWLMNEIRALASPAITDVRGLGLMIGVELNTEAGPVVMRMLEHGVIANATAGNVVRLVPPLTISMEEMREALNVFEKSLNAIEEYA